MSHDKGTPPYVSDRRDQKTGLGMHPYGWGHMTRAVFYRYNVRSNATKFFIEINLYFSRPTRICVLFKGTCKTLPLLCFNSMIYVSCHSLEWTAEQPKVIVRM